MAAENLGSIYSIDFTKFALPVGIYIDGRQNHVELRPDDIAVLLAALREPSKTSPALAQMREYLQAALLYVESGGQSARTGGTA